MAPPHRCRWVVAAIVAIVIDCNERHRAGSWIVSGCNESVGPADQVIQSNTGDKVGRVITF